MLINAGGPPIPKLSQLLLLISRKGSYCFQHVSILLSHIDMRSSDNSVHACTYYQPAQKCSLLGSETENGQDGGGLIKMVDLWDGPEFTSFGTFNVSLTPQPL